MPKQINIDTMTFVKGNILYNYIEGGQYYPAAIVFQGTSEGEGAKRKVSELVKLGTPQNDPYTPQELYSRTATVLGQNVADALKALYINGINTDISA